MMSLDYRNPAIKKAEDMNNEWSDCKQLELNGIMLIENDFINSDIVSYDVAQAIVKEVDQIGYCQPVKLEKSHQDLLIKFAQDMVVRCISTTEIQNDINEATLVKTPSPNSALTKSLGADIMINDSAK